MVDVSVTFNPTNNNYDFFNDNYEQIMTGMAQAAQVSQSAIIVKSIIYNSVILNAQITTTSGNTGNIQNSVNNYFKNLQIANLEVAQSSIVDPNESENSGSNTTLIVAIVVPIVVVVVVATVVIICCMRSRKNNLREMERRVQMNTTEASTARDYKTSKKEKMEKPEENEI